MTTASSPDLSPAPVCRRVAFGVTMALTHISAYTASLLFLLTIVLTMGNAALFLHERVTSLMLLGAGCICAALMALVAAPRVPSTTPDSLSGRAGTVERIRVHPSTDERRKHT